MKKRIYLSGALGCFDKDDLTPLAELENPDIHPWKIEQIDRIETGKNALAKAMTYIVSYY